MSQVRSRMGTLGWTRRGGLVWLAALAAFVMESAAPALAGSWSAPVALPGSCGTSVTLNQAGAVAAGGTFKAADGTTHVQVCTSPDGKTWQASDLGPGGDEPSSGQRLVVAVGPGGRVVALWGHAPCVTCGYDVQAAVRPAGGQWGAPVTLSTELLFSAGSLVLGMDGSGSAIAAWVGSYADATHYALLPAGGSWGPAQTLSTAGTQGAAHSLGLAVSPNGGVVVAFAGGRDAIWAASGTVLGGLSTPVFVATGDYGKISAPKPALDDAGQASLVWTRSNGIETATRTPSGTWSTPSMISTQPSASVSTAIDGAGNAIAVDGASYAWHPAGGNWGPAGALPSGSSAGLVVADPAGTFVFADSSGNAFTFGAGATGFGTGTGSRGALADLKIVPGLAVMLAAGAASTEAVN